MNEQLTKFIELCLEDGVISDKERKVIFKKAKSLGVDEDECEVLIESFSQKASKEPQPNNEAISKSKRKFTPKTVRKKEPAALDQESKLLDGLAKLTEKEKFVSQEYRAILDDLKTKTEEVQKIKKNVSSDFKKYKETYHKDRKENITKYINFVNKMISERYGKTEIVLAEEQRQKLLDLSIDKVNDYIIEDAKWSTERYKNSSQRF
jgi:adenylosuccinate synthase